MMNPSSLLLVVVVVVCATFSPISADKQPPLAQSGAQNVTKLQARISLESRNLDIDNEKSVNSGNGEKSPDFLLEPTIANSNPSPEAAKKKKKTTRRKKERSERKLSNLWSMFLPGSSASESDYEEVDGGEEISGDASLDAGESLTGSSGTNSSAVLGSGDKSRQQHSTDNSSRAAGVLSLQDERLMSKYSRPPRQDGHSAEFVVTPNTVRSAAAGETTTPQPLSEDKLSTGSLVTGSLSKEIGTMLPSMNESTTLSSSNVSATSTSGLEVEHENDERPSTAGKATNNSKTAEEGPNFERWLNRVHFQETPVVQATPSPGAGGEQPQRASLANGARFAPNNERRGSITREDPFQTSTRLTSARQDLNATSNADQRAHQVVENRHHQQGKQNARVRTSSAGSQRFGAPIHQHPIKGEDQLVHSSRIQQHPFQQQQQHFRQNQAQLIQGIKYPMAQASTISVSTQDGTSNTSLSFSPNSASLVNEISPVISQAPVSVGNSNESPQMVQTEYQSQDEILRQVTSAINFEQQQQQQHQHYGAQKRPVGSDSQSNHRKLGESLAGLSLPSANEIDAPDSLGTKMFKSSSNVNEQVDPTTIASTSPMGTTTSPMELLKATLGRNNNSSSGGSGGGSNHVLGTDDLDKNFDMLAEKLRSLAAHTQQQQPPATTTSPQPFANSPPGGGNQPSWLRRPDPVAAVVNQVNKELLLTGGGSNLTSQLSGLIMNGSSLASPGPSGGGISSSASSNLDKLRDLLSKHERSKNELKSSQATMNLLLKQLLQSDNVDRAQIDKLLNNGANNNSNQPVAQQQQRQNAPHNQAAHQPLIRGEATGVSGSGQQQQQHDKSQPPSGVTNFGWTPLGNGAPGALMPAGSLHAAPVSPANLMKGRLRQPPIKLSQVMDNLSGTGAAGDFAAGNYYMDELAMVLSGGRPAEEANELLGSHKILGVPVALMKQQEHEDEAVEQAQLEAAAKHLARNNRHQQQQLMRPGGGGGNPGKIAQRLAAPPALGNGSPLAGEQLLVVPQQQPASHEHQHHQQQLDKIKGSLPLQVLANSENNPPGVLAPYGGGGNGGGGSGGVSVAGGHQHASVQLPAGSTPIRYREVSIYRPFGYQSHHAIAYQASPAVAALFPGLANGSASPGSLLRPRSPFRSRFQIPAGEGPLAPSRLPLGFGPVAQSRQAPTLAAAGHHHRHQHYQRLPFHPGPPAYSGSPFLEL